MGVVRFFYRLTNFGYKLGTSFFLIIICICVRLESESFFKLSLEKFKPDLKYHKTQLFFSHLEIDG